MNRKRGSCITRAGVNRLLALVVHPGKLTGNVDVEEVEEELWNDWEDSSRSFSAVCGIIVSEWVGGSAHPLDLL